MTPCYLVAITRNKWSDYELITDLPGSLASPEPGLKKRMKSFFPLDYADREIEHSTKLVAPSVHLQSWCGRVESFGLEGLPYVEQIGRPIKLGIGVVQELENDTTFIMFKIADLKELLLPLILEYQSDKNFQPRLIELSSLGINRAVALSESQQEAGSTLSARDEPIQALDAPSDLIQANERQPGLSYEQQRPTSSNYRSLWLDDLDFLSKESLRALDLLGNYSRRHESETIKHFLAVATRKRVCLNSQDLSRDWRRVYKCLADVWSIPIDKQILYIKPKIDLPFWQHPVQGIRDNHNVSLLNQLLELLAESLDAESSLEDILLRYGQISDTFQAILLGMLD